jgi:hypothetical protein
MDQSRMVPSCEEERREDGDWAVPYIGSKERE